MDLAPPGRAAAAATFLVAFGEFRPVDHDRYLYARATRAAAATAVAEFRPRAAGASGRDVGGRRSIAGLLRTAVEGLRRALYPSTWCSGSGTRRFSFSRMAAVAGGDGARGWTSRRRGERPRRPPSLLRLANSAPLTMIATYMRARPAPRRRPLSPIPTSGCWGERPRRRGSPLDRRAVAHSGWGSQACSLSVDVVQRQRHAAIFFFANGRPSPAAMELEDGPRAAGASGRGGHLPCCVWRIPPR